MNHLKVPWCPCSFQNKSHQNYFHPTNSSSVSSSRSLTEKCNLFLNSLDFMQVPWLPRLLLIIRGRSETVLVWDIVFEQVWKLSLPVLVSRLLIRRVNYCDHSVWDSCGRWVFMQRDWERLKGPIVSVWLFWKLTLWTRPPQLMHCLMN